MSELLSDRGADGARDDGEPQTEPWRQNLRPTNRRIPMFVVVLAWVAIICHGAGAIWLLRQPIERADGSQLLIDSRWLYVALPIMYLPTIVVFRYVNWLGWSFFRHN